MPRDVLIADADTRSEASREHRPPGWRQRWLYTRPHAWSLWLDLASTQDFRRPIGRIESLLFGAGRARAKLLADAVLRVAQGGPPFRSVISLGPGDAALDRDLVRVLTRGSRTPTYIPVDVSEELLRHAVAALVHETTVPCAVLADFEVRWDFIAAHVRAHTDAPRVISLLGNTLGNLDRGERSFLGLVRTALAPGDRLLLSVSTKGPEWRPDADPNHGPEGFPDAVRRFLEAGLTDPAATRSGTMTRGAVRPGADPFEYRTGSSDVPGADAVDLFVAGTGEPVICIRRYDWPDLLDWLEHEMEMRAEQQICVHFDGVEGAGVVMLRPTRHGAEHARGL